MKKPPNAFERDVLDVLLTELRRAVRKRAQLSIILDPFVQGGGAYVFAAPSEQGHTYEITARQRKTKPKTKSKETLCRRR